MSNVVQRQKPEPKPIQSVHLSLDYQLATYFVEKYGHSVRCVLEDGVWLLKTRQGTYRQVLINEMKGSFTENVLRNLNDDLSRETREDHKKRLAAMMRHASDEYGLDKALKIASRMPGLKIRRSQLDQFPHLIGVKNGVIDLRQGKLLASVPPHYYVTRSIDLAYHENAKCPLWNKAVSDSFNGDRALIRYMDRLLGACLTGKRLRKIFFFYGPSSGNGKGLILQAASAVLGSLHYEIQPWVLSTDQKSRGPQPELAWVQGKRLVTCSDYPEGESFSSTAKQLTGKDYIEPRTNYGMPVKFRPVAKFIVASNALPTIRANQRALLKRLVVVPFDYQFEETDLDERLEAEYPGILARCVAGAREFYESGLKLPEALKRINADYRKRVEHPLKAWLAREKDRFGRHVGVMEGYDSYVRWCGKKKMVPMPLKTWKMEMTSRFRKGISSGRYVYYL